jgi:acyl-CoA thioester hydrolase
MMSKQLEEFPVVIEIPVAWGEMDSLQHVNNIVFFRYFESARLAYFERIGYMSVMQQTGIGPILASTQAKFRATLTFPDTVSVGARVSTMDDDRFTMKYSAVSHRLGKVTADGEAVIVSYDYRNNRKAPLDELIRQRIKAVERRSKVE